jgi:hypothetical protein
MEVFSVTTCRGCGKEILWAETEHGKKIPLDPKALVFSVVKDDHGRLIAVAPSGGPIGEKFYVSHWATCREVLKPKQDRVWEQPQRNFNEPKEPA